MIIKLKDLLPLRLVEVKCEPGETSTKTGCTPDDDDETSKTNSDGPCEPGETSTKTGCTPEPDGEISKSNPGGPCDPGETSAKTGCSRETTHGGIPKQDPTQTPGATHKSPKFDKENFDKNYSSDLSNEPSHVLSVEDYSEKTFDDKTYEASYSHDTPGGSSVLGTPHAGGVDGDGKYDPTHADNQIVEKVVIPKLKKKVDAAIASGKKVVFVTEGGASDDNPFPRDEDGNELAGEQKRIPEALGISRENTQTWDGEDMEVRNPKSEVYSQMKEMTGNSQEEVRSHMFAFMYSQGDESIKLNKDELGSLRKSGYAGGFPPGSGKGSDVKSLEGDEDWEADRELLELISTPETFVGNEDDWEDSYAVKKYGMDYLKKHVSTESSAAKSVGAYNKSRDMNMKKKIDQIEGSGDSVAIVAPGASHAYLMRNVLGNK